MGTRPEDWTETDEAELQEFLALRRATAPGVRKLLDAKRPTPPAPADTGAGWEVETGVRCVICPACAFTFDAFHTDEGGGYSCPACAEDRERTARQQAEETLRHRTEALDVANGTTASWRRKCDAAVAQRDAAITLAEEAATALTGVDEDQVMLYRQTGYDLLVRLAAMRGNK